MLLSIGSRIKNDRRRRMVRTIDYNSTKMEYENDQKNSIQGSTTKKGRKIVCRALSPPYSNIIVENGSIGYFEYGELQPMLFSSYLR